MNEYGEDTDARDRAFNEGREFEREAIVAWLRSEACFYWLLRNTGGFTRDQAPNLSDAIERGEHLGASDE